MRVLMLVASFFPDVGGVQTQALVQSQLLRQRGYEVDILTLRHQKAWPAEEQIAGVPVKRVAGRLLYRRTRLPGPLQRLWYLLAMLVVAWHLWRLQRRYDFLHVHQLNVIALPAALVAWLVRKPALFVMHSSTAGIRHFSDQTRLACGPLDPSLPWLKVEGLQHNRSDLDLLARAGRPLLVLVRTLLRRSSATIVILSSRMRADLKTYAFSLEQVQRIPNGVDTRHFRAVQERHFADTPQIVICLARLEYVKGVDVLLQAWKQVQEQVVRPARLLLIGDGSLRSQLEQLAQVLGVTETVEFAGQRSDILEQLQHSMLCVLPSRREGLPNALLEAMACGLPCVATRVAGSEDIIQQGVNGLLVEPEDETALAQALLTALSQPELLQIWGNAARTTVEKSYTLEHIIDLYIDIYVSICSKTGE